MIKNPSTSKSLNSFAYFTNDFIKQPNLEVSEQDILIFNILKSLSFINASFGSSKKFTLNSSLFKVIIDIQAQKTIFEVEGKPYLYKKKTIENALSLFESFQSLMTLSKEEENYPIIQKEVESMADRWALLSNQVETDKKDAFNHLKGQTTLIATLWKNRH